MCYSKRLEQIKIRSKLVRENRLQGRQAYYDQIRAELPYLNGINEGKLNMGFNLFFDLVYAKGEKRLTERSSCDRVKVWEFCYKRGGFYEATKEENS